MPHAWRMRPDLVVEVHGPGERVRRGPALEDDDRAAALGEQDRRASARPGPQPTMATSASSVASGRRLLMAAVMPGAGAGGPRR